MLTSARRVRLKSDAANGTWNRSRNGNHRTGFPWLRHPPMNGRTIQMGSRLPRTIPMSTKSCATGKAQLRPGVCCGSGWRVGELPERFSFARSGVGLPAVLLISAQPQAGESQSRLRPFILRLVFSRLDGGRIPGPRHIVVRVPAESGADRPARLHLRATRTDICSAGSRCANTSASRR